MAGRPTVIFTPEIEAEAVGIFSHVADVSFYRGRLTWAECRDTISLWIDHAPHSVDVLDSR